MRHSSSIPAIAVGAALFLFPLVAHAQQPQAQEQSGPTLTQSADAFDMVVLKSGGFFRGRITEIVPDDHVTMTIAGGNDTKRFGWSTIARVVTSTSLSSGAAASSPAAIAPPSTAPWLEPHEPGHLPNTDSGGGGGGSSSSSDWVTPPRPRPPEWHPNRPLLIGGVVLFSVAYGATLLATVESSLTFLDRFFEGRSFRSGGLLLWLPVIGPLLFAGTHPRDADLNSSGGELSSTGKAALYTSAAVQFAGVTLMTLGLAFGKTTKPAATKEGAAAAPAPPLPRPSFFVAPLSMPNAQGISVGFHSW